jgi:phosphopantetheine--protein transferase-like protein
MLAIARMTIQQIDANAFSSLAELASSMPSRAGAASIIAIVADSLADCRAKLQRASSMLGDGRRTRVHDGNGIYFYGAQLAQDGKLAAVFPGEGSQYDGALRGMSEAFPELADFLVPLDAPTGSMWDMSSAVTRVLSSDFAIGWLLNGFGVQAAAMIGHSTGAMAALIGANRIEARSAASLREFFGDLERMRDGVSVPPPPMSLIAAGGSAHDVTDAARAVDPSPMLAMINCPHQTVIVVSPENSGPMLEAFADKGILAELLPFDRPYHTKLFSSFVPQLDAFYSKWLTQPGDVPVYCCSTTEPMPSKIETARAIAVNQWIEPVRFAATIERMYGDGFRVFVEAGPRGNLSAFIGDILRWKPHAAIPADLPHRPGPVQIVHVLAQLAAHGFNVETDLSRRATRAMLQSSPLATAAMKSHLEFMEQFYDTQRAVMEAYVRRKSLVVEKHIAPHSDVPTDTSIPDLPLLGTILSRTPDELIAIRDFNTDEDLFLRDHSFGGKVSRLDPSLYGLPVMPLTMTLEFMAEAASVLENGKVLVAIDDISARRWATSDTGRFSLRVEASRTATGDGIHVRVHEHDVASPDVASKRPPLAEATLVFADEYPEAPPVKRFGALAQHTRIDSDVIYDRHMFHGPAFRGTMCVDEVAPDGARASLIVPTRDSLFASRRDPHFITDPVLLDQPGQVLGVWMDVLSSGNPVAFPVSVRSVRIFAGPLPPGEKLTCEISGASTEDGMLMGELDIVRADGVLWGRISGWKDRRFDLPEKFRVNALTRTDYHLSEPMSVARDSVPDVIVRCIGADLLPADVLESGAGVWTRTLAAIVLSQKERDYWRKMTPHSDRSAEWLIGRAVAKDALRSFVLSEFGLGLLSADIEVETGANGSPHAAGPWTKLISGSVPRVSISHAPGMTVAAVASGSSSSGVGIDVERIDRINDDVSAIAFTDDEADMILSVPEPLRPEWRARVWCAKEAAAKATGEGLNGRPDWIAATSIDLASGVVTISTDGMISSLQAPSLSVTTSIQDNFAFGVCVLMNEPAAQTVPDHAA